MDDLPTVRGLVAAGLGVALVPAMGEDPQPAGGPAVRLVGLADDGARRDIGLAWSTERSMLPAAEIFRRYLLTQARSMSSRRASSGSALVKSLPNPGSRHPERLV